MGYGFHAQARNFAIKLATSFVRRPKLDNRGDTIVEVLLATVILSAVLTTSYNLANRATITNQNAIERYELANILQEQAEFLKVARDQQTETDAWDKILDRGTGVSSDPTSPTSCLGADLSNPTPTVGNPASFHLELVGGNTAMSDSYLGPVGGQEYYVWIDTVENLTGAYSDFVINACWPSLGSAPNSQTGVVLRLENAR